MNLKHEVLINVMAKQEALNRRRNECNDVEANHGREEAESLAGAPPREEDERKRKPREARGSFSTPSSTPGMPRPTHSARWSSALMSCADVADPSALTSPPNSDDGSGRENLPHKDLIDAVNRVMWQRSQMGTCCCLLLLLSKFVVMLLNSLCVLPQQRVVNESM
eukprot:GHVQ01038599.1.p1 GENE.GHVQ01038599.1~~GHVQ01038599.1.p1  ORF type:complete len:165 (+),score=26.42 GHVQ01038599.1:3-497(+)